MTASVGADGQRSARDDVARPRRWPTDTMLWFAVFVPHLVVAVPWTRSDWFPVQDQAVLAMRMQDLLSGELPLLGAFSRYGWSHPGPIWFYVLAPFRLLGGETSWLVVGSILLVGAGFATTVVVVRRRFGTGPGTVAVLACAASAAGTGTFALVAPWNPNLAFAWFGVFLVLCLSSASLGLRSDLFAAGFVGSTLVQLHVGYSILVLTPLAFAAALVLAQMKGSPRERAKDLFAGRAARGWLLAIVVVWIPPLADLVTHGRDGNIVRLAEFFVVGQPETTAGPAGWGFAAGIVGEATPTPMIFDFIARESIDPFTGDVVAGSAFLMLPVVLLLALAAVVAVRHADGRQIRAVVICAASLAGALASGAQLVGDRWPYLIVWRYAVVWFAIAVTATVLLARIPRPSWPDPAHSLHVLLAIALVLFGATTLQRGRARPPDEILPYESSTRRLTDGLLTLDPPQRPVTIVRFGAILEGVGDGVLRVVDLQGWPVGVTEDLAFKYGSSRVVPLTEAGQVWLVTESSVDTTLVEMHPASVTLAKVTPLTAAEDARLAELQEKLLVELETSGRGDLTDVVGSSLVAFALADAGIDLDHAFLDELAQLNAKVETSELCRCAVVEVPTSAPQDRDAALELAALAWTGPLHQAGSLP